MMFLDCLWLRFASCVLFLASAAALLTWRCSQREQADVGGTARHAFISCFCVGQLARGLSNAAQIFLCNGERCVHDWRCALLRGLADVPFLAAYGLFVGFLGYLGHTAAGRAAPRFYPLVVLVCAVYAVLVLALAAEALGGPTAAAGHLDFALMGSTYAALAVLLAVNRHQLLRTLSGAPFPVPPGLAQLLNRMCALLGATFVAQAFRYAVWTRPSVEEYVLGRELGCGGGCAADFLLNILTEFAPCALGLLLLRPAPPSAEERAPRRRLSERLSSTERSLFTDTDSSASGSGKWRPPGRVLSSSERARLADARSATEQRYSAV